MPIFTIKDIVPNIQDHGFDKNLIRTDPGRNLLDSITPELRNIFTEGISPKTITAGQLLEFFDTGQAGVSGEGSLSSSIRFWAGEIFTNRATAPFRVDQAGVLTATGAIISGTITATSGTIGGFDIGADYLRDAVNTMGLASTVTGGDDVRFWAGASFANRATAPFRITEAGALVTTNATITGTITGGTIRTASSGARVEMLGSDNTLKLYDATGTVVEIGATGGSAIRINTTTDNSNGIIISSAVGGFALNYTNTLSNLSGNAGVVLTLSGASNTASCLTLTNNGISGAQGLLMTMTGGAVGMHLDKSGTQNAITLNNTGTGKTIEINDSGTSGTAPAVSISYARQGIVMDLVNSAPSGNPTGIKLNVGVTSNGYAFEFAGNIVVSSGVTGVQNRKIRVLLPSGAVYFIPLHDA